MCKAKEIQLDFERAVSKLRSETRLAIDKIAQCDRELSKFYHSVEVRPKPDAVEGYYMGSQLHQILQKRRKAKMEFDKLKSLSKSLTNSEKNILDVIDTNLAGKNLEKIKKKHDEYISVWAYEETKELEEAH